VCYVCVCMYVCVLSCHRLDPATSDKYHQIVKVSALMCAMCVCVCVCVRSCHRFDPATSVITFTSAPKVCYRVISWIGQQLQLLCICVDDCALFLNVI